MVDKCNWTGASGTKYLYDIYPIGTDWDDTPGNYVFAKRSTEPAKWDGIYIGETESFKDRLPHHNELPCINRNGATHIHIRTNNSETTRLAEERDLLANHTTPCNG